MATEIIVGGRVARIEAVSPAATLGLCQPFPNPPDTGPKAPCIPQCSPACVPSNVPCLPKVEAPRPPRPPKPN